MRLAQVRVHFIGIGGIGMCGLAELFHNMGTRVSGSDLSENAQVAHLKELGVPIVIGHRAENINDAEVVVYSSAVKSDNLEFREARKRKIPLIPRAEALAEIMRIKRGVAIGGSHGKTTTTSLTASVFLKAGAEPTIVVGGRLDLIKSTALLGQGQWLVAEADESDGSFLKLSPEIVVITNIDNDHLDHYGTLESLKKAFADFAARIPFYGLAIVCGDDPLIREVFADFSKRILFYGFNKENDLRLEPIADGKGSVSGAYRVQIDGAAVGEFRLQVPGRHNALNAAAALATGLEAGFSFATCAQGLEAFAGVDRRFQFKGEARVAGGAVDIYDDYGHHPTEVRAVMQAFKEKFPGRRVLTVFQPHRYSRTKLCWDQFLECFSESDYFPLNDKLWICDIYSAGESPIPDVSSEHLAGQARGGHGVVHLPNGSDRVEILRRELKPGDVLVTLGAGDVWKLGTEILNLAGGSVKL